MAHVLKKSHSATVEMWLDCGPYGVVELTRIGPRAVFARFPREIPPCDAELVVTVDHSVDRRPVNLTNGFSRGRHAARAMARDDSAPF
jgi:hypothetical protein